MDKIVTPTKVITWLLEVTGDSPEPEVPQAQVEHPTQPQQPNDLDQMVRGPEDGVKSFIDKMIDIKNKALGETSKQEISKLIQVS